MAEAEFRISLTPDDEAVGRLLEALEAFAAAEDLPPRATHHLALVCEELVANVAMHGSAGPAPASRVSVAVQHRSGRLDITVEDDGPAFDPLAAAPADTDAPLEDRGLGGLGLHVVRRIAREARYARENGRNRLWLLLDAAA